MKRVVIFGCAGTGKSTLARKLAARTGLPLAERDAMGTEGSQQYLAALAKLGSEPAWILDGAPYYAEAVIYPVTDTLIVLDYVKPVVMWRVLRRTLSVELLRRPRGAHQPQGLAAWRDPEHPVRWAWASHQDRHQQGLALAGAPGLAGATIIQLTTPAAARRWLRAVERPGQGAVTRRACPPGR